MVTKVNGRPYFFVITTRLLKDNLKCLVNKQSKTEDKKEKHRRECVYTVCDCVSE